MKTLNKTCIKYICTLICTLVFFLIACVCMASQDQYRGYHCVTDFENGRINWSTGAIYAKGYSPDNNSIVQTLPGMVLSEKHKELSSEFISEFAKAEAKKHMIDVLKQVKINSALNINEYASKKEVIWTGIEKIANDARISAQYYTSALGVEIILETSMFGGFLQLVLPEEIRQISKVSQEISQQNTKTIEEIPYTGLIIDARGLEIEPVLNPVIISEQGHDIYSSVFISREFAVQNGVCKYLCSMDQALKDKRTGSHPLILKGLSKGGKQNTSIIVSMSDYNIIEKRTERHVFLKECKVIIVKD